ncbi:enoyl-CoA hydratase/isomerase family protein [Halomonas halocynthiae]|uniref:enoyl-CoA hydratase/isomerase family protein n=1 Tax=Halomonas halocynthiae TaxID=176290 RepID=UPI00041D2E7A|nr:enoyl-CoA hydratase/isomerase family protein [Halomonas halocynthiae]
MSEFLKIYQSGGVLNLTLNRPESLNALNNKLYHDLSEALETGDRDETISVIRLTGAGNSFCAGNDLNDFIDYIRGDKGLEGPKQLLLTLAKLQTPLVASVQGHAIGIGTTILLHCDQVVCSKETKFKMPFTGLGVVPEGGSSKLLVDWLGHPRAFSLLVMGETCDANTALQLGLVNQVVEPEVLDDAVNQRIQKLLSLPREAVFQAKRLLRNHGRREALQKAIKDELEIFSRLLASEEAQHAIRKTLG